jgi:two-component system sensor histidine kinase/response regulator
MASPETHEPSSAKNDMRELPVPLPDHLLGVLGAIVFVFDAATSRPVYVSKQVEEILGYTAHQILDDPELLRRTVHAREAPYVLDVLSALLREKVDQRLELPMIAADGREIWVDGVVSVLRENGRPRYVLGVLLDITERKRLEDALRTGKERLEERVRERTAELRKANEELDHARLTSDAATRAKSEFLANMSHDIRTPMNGILGMAELLAYTELTPKQREYVEMVRASAESLLHLLNDILDFSKIEAGRLELLPVSFHLYEAMGDMLHAFSVQAAAQGIELAYRVSPEIPDVLVGDIDRLRQVMTNLVGNALKFTEQGEIAVEVTQLERANDHLVLCFVVRDTGIGIPSDQQQGIFEAFQQVLPEHAGPRPSGTGLGLTIASRIVSMMGGTIWVESEPGEGSAFYFTVRFEAGQEREGPSRQLESSMADMHVLVVDDSPTNRRMLEDNLSRWGARTVAVGSAEEALEAIDGSLRSGAPFQLVLLDAILRGATGASVARAIRGRGACSDTPILMLSSAEVPLDAEEQRELRIARVLRKPLRRSQLLDAILDALGIGSVTPEPRAAQPRTVAPMRLLVVDDNPINQRVTRELLARRGHEVSVASDGQRALESLERERFDCVLMDVEMPVMNGIEVTAAIRAREHLMGGHTPVIAMTAYAMKGDRERMLHAGMDAYLAKPARTVELFEAVERYGAPAAKTTERAPSAGPGAARSENVDLELALARVGASQELLMELAQIFIEQRPAMIDELRRAVSSKDSASLRRAAHTLKGSVAIFGARHAVELAAQLEQAGREGRHQGTERVLAALEEELDHVHQALASMPRA